jgi:signal transduction histidine kinase
MHNGVLTGVFGAWCVAYLLMGLSFVGAYLGRRKDAEYLVFGLLTLALALLSAGLAAQYETPDAERWRWAHLTANTGAIAAVALGVHFGLLVRGSDRPRRILGPVYAVATVFALLLWSGQWFDLARAETHPAHMFGYPLSVVRAPPTLVAVAFYTFAVAGVATMTLFLASALRRGKREALGALVGSALLSCAVAIDVLAMLRASSWADLSPHAYLLLAFGVAETLHDRYRRTSRDLERRSLALERQGAELRTTCEELSSVRSELLRRQQLAAVGEVTAVVAHEVRNPLGVITNAVSILRNPRTTPDRQELLVGIIDEEVARLNDTVGDLLAFVRPLSTARDAVDVRELAEHAAAAVPASSKIDVVIDCEAEAYAMGDAMLLGRVLDNVVQNAVQSMPGGGKLTIEASLDDEDETASVVILVKDTGKGMTPDVRVRARDPFFTTGATGTGLGLAIVDRILETHGGALEFESTPGVGTTVRIKVPASRAQAHSSSSVKRRRPVSFAAGEE